MRRFLTHGQFVARAGLRLLGRVLLFGTLTFILMTLLVTWLQNADKVVPR